MNFAALNPNRFPHRPATHLPFQGNTEDSPIP
jgi:hypothetical protein